MPINQVQPDIVFLKCPVPSQENGYSYIIIRFCVCYILMLCRSSPLILDAFPSVKVCNPDLFFSQSIYEFRTAINYFCLYLQRNIRIFNRVCLSTPSQKLHVYFKSHTEHWIIRDITPLSYYDFDSIWNVALYRVRAFSSCFMTLSRQCIITSWITICTISRANYGTVGEHCKTQERI